MENGGFAPVVVRRGLVGPARVSAESRRWTLSRSTTVQLAQQAAVTHLSFSPLAPHDVAAASGPTVAIVDPNAGAVRRTLARFRDVAHSPDFKPDGRLLVAGCENGTVQLFDLSSRAVLRAFKGHGGAVHSTKFTADGLRVMSGCDDGVVRAWDLGTSRQLFSLRGSADYVRTQALSPTTKHIWATGSYDRRARVYDLRTRELLFTLNHGYQVDQVLLLPGGSRAVTIGGPEVKIWDFFAGGTCAGTLRNHAKAVTCGALNCTGEKLLTGGLDGLVKVHDISNLELLSSMSFGGQVLSLAVAPQDSRIAVGLLDGTVDIRARKSGVASSAIVPGDAAGAKPAGGGLISDEPVLLPQATGALKERLFDGWGRGFEKPKRKEARPGTMRYYLRGQNAKPTDDRDIVVKKRRRTGLKTHDVLLRKFAYGEALDSVLVSTWNTKKALVAFSVIEELIARDGLRAALSGRDSASLEPLLSLISSKINEPAHSAMLAHLTDTVLDMYGAMFGQADKGLSIDGLLFKIHQKVRREVALVRHLSSMQGMLEMLQQTVEPTT